MKKLSIKSYCSGVEQNEFRLSLWREYEDAVIFSCIEDGYVTFTLETDIISAVNFLEMHKNISSVIKVSINL